MNTEQVDGPDGEPRAIDTADWEMNREHDGRTARAWRENLERRRSDVLRVFRDTYGDDAHRWYHRWRLFFLACEELFAHGGGREWMVGHFRLAPRESA